MITDNDIKKLKTVFSTKEEIEQVEINVGKGFLDSHRQFTEVRFDISELKGDVAELKDDFKDMKLQMHGMEKNIISAIRDLKEDHETTKQHVTKLERVAFAN